MFTRARLLAVLGATSLLPGVALQAEEAAFPLLDGTRQAVIVGQSLYLNGAVERCTGRKLVQVPEKQYQPAPDRFPLYVGATRKAQDVLAGEIGKLDVEGYILLVTPEYAVIYAGESRTRTGTPLVWAEGDFARRFMGVDHYMPGPLGQVYPKADRLLVPCGKWVENPAFKSRQWTGYAGSAGPTWRVLASGGDGRFAFHHNLWRVIDPKKYAGHPEYFPEINGARSIPAGPTYWQPCTSNPDVRRIAVETILAAFDKEGQRAHAFSLGVNDSGGYCQCALCRKDTPAGVDPTNRAAAAYRFFKFYNAVAGEVAARYPDARLGFLAYSALSVLPTEKLNPILMPYLTQNQADAFDPVYRKRIDDHFSNWGKVGSHLGMYEYLYGGGFMIPRLYSHELARGLRQARRCGADGFYAEAYPNWGLDGPKLWIAEKLLWNPDQDVDALLDTWCRGMFGSAAAAMRAYFERLERAWTEQKPADEKRGGYRLMGPQFKEAQFTQVFPPVVCDEAWALLEAAGNATTNGQALARIAFFRSAFGATRLASVRFGAARVLAGMVKDGRRRTPMEWLVALEEWARFPSMDAYMAEVRTNAPLSFPDFCVPGLKPDQPLSFAAWDTDAPAIRQAVNAIVSEAGAPAGGPAPRDKEEFDARIAAVLEAAVAQAKQAGQPCENAVRVVRPLLASAAMEAAVLNADPVIDGTIEAEWGKPSFDGAFFEYPFEAQPSALKTRLWVAIRGHRLCLAFDCVQDPAGIGAAPSERDALLTVEKKGQTYVDLGKPLPYLGADAVGVALPGYVAAVTAAGGIMDLQSTPYGPRADWNGADAKVVRTGTGWSAEMAVTLDPRSPLLRAGAKAQLNFFRCTSRPSVRSAWSPAFPNLWSYSPGAGGTVFFPAPAAAGPIVP